MSAHFWTLVSADFATRSSDCFLPWSQDRELWEDIIMRPCKERLLEWIIHKASPLFAHPLLLWSPVHPHCLLQSLGCFLTFLQRASISGGGHQMPDYDLSSCPCLPFQKLLALRIRSSERCLSPVSCVHTDFYNVGGSSVFTCFFHGFTGFFFLRCLMLKKCQRRYLLLVIILIFVIIIIIITTSNLSSVKIWYSPPLCIKYKVTGKNTGDIYNCCSLLFFNKCV